MNLPLQYVLDHWRPGSYDRTWDEEFADLGSRQRVGEMVRTWDQTGRARDGILLHYIRSGGVLQPVTLGTAANGTDECGEAGCGPDITACGSTTPSTFSASPLTSSPWGENGAANPPTAPPLSGGPVPDRPCYGCGGSGQQNCRTCGGSGQKRMRGGGSGAQYERCTNCGGSGHVRCPSCGGSGRK